MFNNHYTHGYPSNGVDGQWTNKQPPSIIDCPQAPNLVPNLHLSTGQYGSSPMNTHPGILVYPSKLASPANMQAAFNQCNGTIPYSAASCPEPHQPQLVQGCHSTSYSQATSSSSSQTYSNQQDHNYSRLVPDQRISATNGRNSREHGVLDPKMSSGNRLPRSAHMNSNRGRVEDSSDGSADVEWPKRAVSRKRYQPSKPELRRRDKFLTNMEIKAEERSREAGQSCGEDSD